MEPPSFSFFGPLPRIYGTQIGLRDPAVVEQIKADMLNNQFAFAEVRARLSGVIDPAGCYYVLIGHHRLAAA